MWNTQYGLYPYQRRAADRMQEANMLLAFEMGCGKTPTTLAAIEQLRGDDEIEGLGTVVVPASLKWQWAREIAKFTDQPWVVIDGPLRKRRQQYTAPPPSGYLICSYNTFVSDYEYLDFANAFLVLDEATAIKGFDTKRTQHFKRHRKHYPIRFALTGTPVENGKAEEVFSILEWVEPEVLGKFWKFDKRYIRRNSMGWIDGYKNIGELHRRIAPHTARATHKEPEVARYLPKVLYRDPYRVPMDRRTKKAVDHIAGAISADLDQLADDMLSEQWHNSWRSDHPDGSLMAKIQVMRMLLAHPEAVLEAASLHEQAGGTKTFALEVMMSGVLDRLPAPKMDAVVAYVNDHLDADPANKAVIFSTYKHPARLLAQALGRHQAVLFHGELSSAKRDAVRHRFVSDPDCRVFVSTDAGGYGLDLPQANLLCNLDLPWQAGLLQQRNARIRRASSEWEFVTVQDFLVEGTIDQRIAAMIGQKLALAEALVDGEDDMIVSDIGSLRSFLTSVGEK